jgi:hypothetical protein
MLLTKFSFLFTYAKGYDARLVYGSNIVHILPNYVRIFYHKMTHCADDSGQAV